MPATESSSHLLSRTALPLILRGFVIAGFQHFGKRIILAKADESLLTTYAVYSAIEGLIFILIFRGLRIVSATVSHVYAKEKNPNKNILFDPAEIGVVYRQGVLFGCVLMIPAALLCAITPFLFRWTKQPDVVLQNCISYFSWGFLSYFIDMLYRSRARVDIGMTSAFPVLIGDISESVLDVAFTYIFVNGKCGMPKMGVAGSAIAYTIAAAITALGYHLRSYFTASLQPYHLYRFSFTELKTTIISHEFKTMMIGGFHIAFKYAILYITLMLTTFICGLSGSGALAGLQAAGAYGYLVTLPLGGLSEAASVVIGRLYQDHWQEAKKIGNAIMMMGLLYSYLCAAALFIFINPVARLFVDETQHPTDFQIVKQFLRVQAIMEIVNSVGNTGGSVLAGCLETRLPFLLSMLFIFVMNSVLAVTTYFGFHGDALSMYSIQILGLFFNALGVWMQWRQHTNPNEKPMLTVDAIIYRAKTTLFRESPRRHQIEMGLPLPAVNSV